MAIDCSLQVRRGAIMKLAATPELTDIVPEESIFADVTAQPIFPFIRVELPALLPIRATCVDGSEGGLAAHVFAKDRMFANVTVEPAQDYSARIAAIVADALDGALIILTNGSIKLLWRGTQHLPDPAEKGAFHSVIRIGARAITG